MVKVYVSESVTGRERGGEGTERGGFFVCVYVWGCGSAGVCE